MIVQRVEFSIREGQEQAFADEMQANGLRLFTQSPGCRSARIGRGARTPSLFLIIAEWDALADYERFFSSPAHATFGGLIRDYITGASMELFDMA